MRRVTPRLASLLLIGLSQIFCGCGPRSGAHPSISDKLNTASLRDDDAVFAESKLERELVAEAHKKWSESGQSRSESPTPRVRTQIMEVFWTEDPIGVALWAESEPRVAAISMFRLNSKPEGYRCVALLSPPTGERTREVTLDIASRKVALKLRDEVSRQLGRSFYASALPEVDAHDNDAAWVSALLRRARWHVSTNPIPRAFLHRPPPKIFFFESWRLGSNRHTFTRVISASIPTPSTITARS